MPSRGPVYKVPKPKILGPQIMQGSIHNITSLADKGIVITHVFFTHSSIGVPYYVICNKIDSKYHRNDTGYRRLLP